MIVTKCPHCGRQLQVQTEHVGKKARCGSCREVFVITAPKPKPEAVPVGILIKEPPQPAPPRKEASLGLKCDRHPEEGAEFACAGCRAPMCRLCKPARQGGRFLCRACAGRGTERVSETPAREAPRKLAGMMCAQHSSVEAVRRCKFCRTPVCATCDFTFPGRLHVCPECATNPPQGLSPNRKLLVGISFGLAVLATLGLVVLLSGALASLVHDEGGLVLAVLVFFFLPIASALAGTALGVSAFERNLPNPIIIWVPAVWNGLLMVGLVLLFVAGAMRGG